jgi:spore coat polysaccharide biosynthesis protein SpsF
VNGENMSGLNVIAIVLARMDSSRLPGKALKFVNGRPLISYCIERAQKVRGIGSVVLATSTRPVDDPLAQYAFENGVKVYRGESNNVAKRCLDCALLYQADYFLRVNADSPFLDTLLVEDGLSLIKNNRPDLVTNLIVRSYPFGVAVELIKVQSFASMITKMSEDQAEHVTKFHYDNRNSLNIEVIKQSEINYSTCRLVVDDEEDFLRFEALTHAFGGMVANLGYQIVSDKCIELELM